MRRRCYQLWFNRRIRGVRAATSLTSSESIGPTGDIPVRIHPDVVFRVLGDGAVLVNLSTNEIFELNTTGTAVWTMVERGAGPDAIVAELTTAFDVAPDTARDECERLLGELQARGLLLP
jgi:hypothetical protein